MSGLCSVCAGLPHAISVPTESPVNHYLKFTGVPERIGSRTVLKDELLMESFDVNGDSISDVFISNVYADNGKAGYIWSPYLSTLSNSYQRVDSVTFHRIGQTAFVDANGIVYSPHPDGASGGAVVSIRWCSGWLEELYATYKRAEDLSTLVETKDGESFVVGASDNLMGKIEKSLLSAPCGVNASSPSSSIHVELSLNVDCNENVVDSKRGQEGFPLTEEAVSEIDKESTFRSITSYVWSFVVAGLFALLGVMWFFRIRK